MTDMTTSKPSETTQAKVIVERTYRAQVEELWALWTTKEGFESWWGPEGFRVEVSTLEARVGGAIAYAMIADAPDAIAAMEQAGWPRAHDTHGRFAEFAPHTRLRLVHAIDFIPGVEPYDSTIEVDFHPAGDHARMVVTLHPHRDPHWTSQAAAGFGSQLTKLDRRFGAAAR